MAFGIDPTELSAAVGVPDYAAMELIRDRCFIRDPLVEVSPSTIRFRPVNSM